MIRFVTERMKLVFCLILFIFNFASHAQIITTVAGNGTGFGGYSGDGGLAINARLGDMYYCYPAFDNAGNMYIAQTGNNTIRKIDAAGIITTIAGTNGIMGYTGDGGPAINALLYHPTALAVDNANNLFISDRNGGIIRKIDPAGIITTVSGQFVNACGVGDGGTLAFAQFYAISAITFDRLNNLYISDYGCNVIRKVNNAGIITTIAGNGTYGFSGDGGLATAARLAYPCKVAIDAAGNVYIADAQNHRIRKVDNAGIITTVAGVGTWGYSGDGGPAVLAQFAYPGSVVADNTGSLYVGDYNHVIRKIDPGGIISTYAGTGVPGYSGDNGPANQAELELTEGRISIDNNNNIYFVNYQFGQVIRKISECNTATISQQPLDVNLCNSGNAIFNIGTANGTGFQWQLNTGSGWANIADNNIYAGSMTRNLSLTGANVVMDNYQYRCQIKNSCGFIYSTNAHLSITTSANPAIKVTATSTNICAGNTVTFSASATNGGNTPIYQWQKNGLVVGNNNVTYTDNNLVSGDIIHCLLTSNANCTLINSAVSNDILMTVTGKMTPAITITSSDNNICPGSPVTFSSTIVNGGSTPGYTWLKNNSSISLNSPTYTDNTLKNGDVISCTLQTDLTCVTSASVTSLPIVMNVQSEVSPSVIISASANPVCRNTNVVFTSNVINAGTNPGYQWQKNGLPVGNNSNIYNDNNLVNGDVITCILSSVGKCILAPSVTSEAIMIDIRPDPVLVLEKDGGICKDGIKILDAGIFSSYLWNTGSTDRTITVSKPGFYSVIVTDLFGCTATGASDVSTVFTSPVDFLPADTSLCSYGNIIIKANAVFSNYLWSTGSASSSITATQPGTFWLKVIDKNGCKGIDSILVFSKTCLSGFYMPTGFTPNGDGKNDLLKPVIFGNIKQYKFLIYNRWGQIVFQSTSSAEAWDGKFKGSLQDGNVYVWTCQYQFDGESPQYQKGTVILIK